MPLFELIEKNEQRRTLGEFSGIADACDYAETLLRDEGKSVYGVEFSVRECLPQTLRLTPPQEHPQ